MCREMILHFTKCRHRAQTLTICGRNGINPPKACNGTVGRFIQRNTVCHGCHRILVYLCDSGSTVEEVKTVKGVTNKMPFGYVIYGQLPWSLWGRHESPRSDMLVGLESDGVDPLEEVLVMLGETDQPIKAQQEPAACAHKRKAAKSPTRSSLKARKARATTCGRTHQNAPVHTSENSATRSTSTANVPRGSEPAHTRLAIRPLKSSSSKLSSKVSFHSCHDPSSAHHTEERGAIPTSTSSRPQRTSSDQSTARPKVKKQVSFAPAAVVQYFNKKHTPMAVKNEWREADTEFALEGVSWDKY